MKNSFLPKTDESYIGYQPNATPRTSRFLKRVIVGIAALVGLASMILALHQRNFSTATFEYGAVTSIEGYLYTSPIPHLKLLFGEDLHGNELQQNLLLVGFGKAGADSLLREAEKRLLTSLDGKH